VAFARRVAEESAGHGFIAAASMKRAGTSPKSRRVKSSLRRLRALAHDFEHVALNSGSSSRKSTP